MTRDITMLWQPQKSEAHSGGWCPSLGWYQGCISELETWWGPRVSLLLGGDTAGAGNTLPFMPILWGRVWASTLCWVFLGISRKLREAQEVHISQMSFYILLLFFNQNLLLLFQREKFKAWRTEMLWGCACGFSLRGLCVLSYVVMCSNTRHIIEIHVTDNAVSPQCSSEAEKHVFQWQVLLFRGGTLAFFILKLVSTRQPTWAFRFCKF